MTNQERIAALESLGYAEREATFLCLAALHSGYFVRRQYCQFLGKKPGYVDDVLMEKILARNDGRVYRWCHKTLVYHLCSQSFYSAIGQANNRHRPTRPPFAAKAKLMALDYILANREQRFLATEKAKISYFTGERGIGIDRLPTKIYRSGGGLP